MKDRKEFYGLMVLEMNNSKTVVLSIIQLTTVPNSKIKSTLRELGEVWLTMNSTPRRWPLTWALEDKKSWAS